MSETDRSPFLEGAEGELWHFIMEAFLTADHAVGDAFFTLGYMIL
ncbi:hypothetical protein [Paenibacillus kribbensis]|nr:hypothetical protein [Paenibacillus kribbensis]